MAAVKRLVVAGGNGFVGSRVCKYAVGRGWDVTSISRSGEPQWDAVTSSATPPSWAHKVSWERADILRPSTYAALLKGADYVVHSLGVLLEADYKGLVRGTESPVDGIRKVFASSIDRGGVDPLRAREGEDIGPEKARDQFSYEVMNRDSAIALARHAAAEKAAAFCYLSAIAGAPVLPSRYLSTKREAEKAIATNFPAMRGVFVRPSFMYDSSRKLTMGIAAAAGVSSTINSLTGGIFSGLMGAGGVKPLQVDVVAQAVVEALSDDTVAGPVEIEQIEKLASQAWRKSML